jgi:hypothetical protein
VKRIQQRCSFGIAGHGGVDRLASAKALADADPSEMGSLRIAGHPPAISRPQSATGKYRQKQPTVRDPA